MTQIEQLHIMYRNDKVMQSSSPQQYLWTLTYLPQHLNLNLLDRSWIQFVDIDTSTIVCGVVE